MRSLFAAVLVASALVLVFRVDRFLPRLADAGCRAVPAAAASARLRASAPQRELQTERLTAQRERTRHEVREVGIGWGGLDVRVESLERETERTETRVRIRGE